MIQEKVYMVYICIYMHTYIYIHIDVYAHLWIKTTSILSDTDLKSRIMHII